MDVTIYYTENYGEAPSGIERMTTPLESGYDRCRACFRQLEEETDTWCLKVERWLPDRSNVWRWASNREHLLLKQRCGSMADYTEWLVRNVALVEVDGRVFWANPDIKEA